jgi:uncharacterized flavoprotein (TIGR03862 family)
LIKQRQIIIVGGGPAGLMAADVLSSVYTVSLYEKEKSIGKKFLLAGKGSFNITNCAEGEKLCNNYTPAGFMDNALSGFNTLAFRRWLSEIGIPTYAGSGGRVFPEGIGPKEIFKLIKVKLENQGVQFHGEHEFVGFENKRIAFNNKGKNIICEPDYCFFALGGASWPGTGSTGSWRPAFESMGISTLPFQSSNCGIDISWPESVRTSHTGKPIKNIRLFSGISEANGEFVVTGYGMEGIAVYRMVPEIRNMLNAKVPAYIHVDFKPLNTTEQLLLKTQGKVVSTKDYGQFFNLSAVQLAVIKAFSDKNSFLSIDRFIGTIKNLVIPVDSLRPVEEAISTIGGIDTRELNPDFSLKKYPWIYTVGEMVDWDAPTGGFLLQGCFAMGHCAARSLLEKE